MDKLIFYVDEPREKSPYYKRITASTENYDRIMDLCQVTHMKQQELADKLLSFALERVTLDLRGEEGEPT